MIPFQSVKQWLGGNIFLSETCLFVEENVMRNQNIENNSDCSISFCWLPNYKMSSTKSRNTSKNQVWGLHGFLSLKGNGELFLNPAIWEMLMADGNYKWRESGLHSYSLSSAIKSLHSLFQAPYPHWALANLSAVHKWQFLPEGNCEAKLSNIHYSLQNPNEQMLLLICSKVTVMTWRAMGVFWEKCL